MNVLNTLRCNRILLLITLFLFISANSSSAQPGLPPRTLTLTATQPICFGVICLSGGVGGTVSVAPDGSRTYTGNVLLISNTPTAQPAIFEIKLCQGRNVSVSFDPTTTLSGDNGGTLILHIGPTDKGTNGTRFSTNSDCNFVTIMRVGGTLDIPSNAIPGNYSGTFNITINQQ
jgi:hypothetical protein